MNKIVVSSRTRLILYWFTTALIAAESAVGGVWDILQIQYVRSIIEHLGYPPYILIILGIWKLLGTVAILLPSFPRLKEWAYAGMFFNYMGAIASHLTVGDGAGVVIYPIIITGILIASWALRPPDRRDIASPSLAMISSKPAI
jgi:uncharacterized membrane protein YphA (DoxX/SURF4 family)